jgi:hypothetical protein
LPEYSFRFGEPKNNEVNMMGNTAITIQASGVTEAQVGTFITNLKAYLTAQGVLGAQISCTYTVTVA